MKETSHSLPVRCLNRILPLHSLLICLCLYSADTAHLYADTSAETERVIRSHIEAVGGRAKLNNLTSLSLHGTIETNGRTKEVYLTKKRDNKMRVSFIKDDIVQIISYDGTHGWEIKENAGTRGEPDAITGKKLSILANAATFNPPLLNFPDNNWTFALAPRKLIDDKECLHVQASDPHGNRYHLFLDPQNYYVLERQTILTLPESNTQDKVSFTTRYENFEITDGYTFAHKIITTDPKGNFTTLTIDKIIPNSGVFDSAFSPPSE